MAKSSEWSCPKGSYRSSLIPWDCRGASGIARVLTNPNRSDTVLTIPDGVQGLRFESRAGVEADLVVLDPAETPARVVVDNRGGVISSMQGSGMYKGMEITCGQLKETSVPWGRFCSISKVTSPLTLKLHGAHRMHSDLISSLAYAYEEVRPCPEISPGCHSIGRRHACDIASHFSHMQHISAVKKNRPKLAWRTIAEPFAFPAQQPGSRNTGANLERTVPWWAWQNVWNDGHEASFAFYSIDSNKDMRISESEFELAYRGIVGSTRCLARNTLQRSLKTVIGWSAEILIVMGILLWLCLCCAILKRCRKPKAENTEYRSLRKLEAPLEGGSAEVRMALDTKHDPPVLDARPVINAVDRLLRTPALRLLIEEHPASFSFHRSRVIGYTELITDGFRALFCEELLLIDARRFAGDLALRAFLDFIRNSIPTDSARVGESVVSACKVIAAVFGGSSENLERRWATRLAQLQLEPPRDLPIGLLLGAKFSMDEFREPGVGLQRHRALMLKYVLDSLRICKSAVLWDADGDAVVIVAWIGGRPMVVDCINHPGMIHENFEVHQVVVQIEGENVDIADSRLARNSYAQLPQVY